MNRTLSIISFPPLPIGPQLRRYDRDLQDKLRQQDRAVVAQLNSQVQGVGKTLTAAATLDLTHAIHKVGGTAAIKNIVAPEGFTGPAMLIPTAVWATVTGGNIGHASAAVVGRVLIMVFDGAQWWPSY